MKRGPNLNSPCAKFPFSAWYLESANIFIKFKNSQNYIKVYSWAKNTQCFTKLSIQGCTSPINGISDYHHIICRLAQVKQKLKLISQYQLILLQLLAEELNIISCKMRGNNELLDINTQDEKQTQISLETVMRATSPLYPVRRWATASFLCWKFCSLITSSDNRCLLAAEITVPMMRITINMQ